MRKYTPSTCKASFELIAVQLIHTEEGGVPWKFQLLIQISPLKLKLTDSSYLRILCTTKGWELGPRG